MLGDGQYDALHRYVEPFRRRRNDAQVSLMRHEPVDLALLEIIGFQNLIYHTLERPDCDLENLIAFHVHRCALALIRGFRYSAIGFEQLAVTAVRTEIRINDPGLLRGIENDGACAIAEQHAGLTIRPIDNPRHRFGTDHERATSLTGAHELIGHSQCVDESAARSFKTERWATGNAKTLLQQATDVWKYQVGSRGADDDHIDRIGSNVSRGNRLNRGVIRQVARRLAFGCDMPLGDSGSCSDPLVGRIDHLL